jgi:hypothetical protein
VFALSLAVTWAQPIVLKSDASTLAAATTNLALLDSGNTAGLTFHPALVGDYGTFTPVPGGAPVGTAIINIPPGGSTSVDGQSGFFKVSFTLPAVGPNLCLAGRANVDDAGRVFLNGHPISPSLTSGDSDTITEYGNAGFGSTNAAWFNPGVNELLIADWNSGGGPSGAAFYAVVYPAGVVRWTGGTGPWSDSSHWLPAPPTASTAVIVPTDSTVTVDVPDVQTGALTLEAGSTLVVPAGAALALNGPGANYGALSILAGGHLTSAAWGWTQSGGSMEVHGWVEVVNVVNTHERFTLDGWYQASATTQRGGSIDVGGSMAVQGMLSVEDATFNVRPGGTVTASAFQFEGVDVDMLARAKMAATAAAGFVDCHMKMEEGRFQFDALSMNKSTFDVGPGGTVTGSAYQFEDTKVQIEAGGQMASVPDPASILEEGLTVIGGSMEVDGSLDVPSLTQAAGAVLSGSGTIDGNLISDDGTLCPGASPGTLTITSNFTQHAGSTLRIEIAGRQPGQFDQLRVVGTATLGGRLEVTLLDSFAPDLGEQFPLLVTSNLSGTFTQVTVPAGISITYTSNSVLPVVTGAVPTQILGPVLSGGNAVFTFGTVTNRGYTVEWTADLASANWQFYTNLTGTGAKVQVAVSLAGAPRRFFRVRQ